MPALEIHQQPIQSMLFGPGVFPSHPSPTVTGLRLERMSSRELQWWGHRFGVDTPYYITPTGWGEWIPLYAWDMVEPPDPSMVRIFDPATEQLVPELFPDDWLYPDDFVYPGGP